MYIGSSEISRLWLEIQPSCSQRSQNSDHLLGFPTTRENIQQKEKIKARGLAGFSIREPKNVCGDNYICEVSIKIVSNSEKVSGVA